MDLITDRLVDDDRATTLQSEIAGAAIATGMVGWAAGVALSSGLYHSSTPAFGAGIFTAVFGGWWGIELSKSIASKHGGDEA